LAKWNLVFFIPTLVGGVKFKKLVLKRLVVIPIMENPVVLDLYG